MGSPPLALYASGLLRREGADVDGVAGHFRAGLDYQPRWNKQAGFSTVCRVTGDSLQDKAVSPVS